MNRRYDTNNSILKDCKGISYVELLVALALLSSILMIAFSFLDFSRNSLSYNQGKYISTQETRNTLLRLERQIRKAKMTTVDGVTYKGVVILNSGMAMNIYMDEDNDGITEMIQYKLDGNKLVMGVAELGLIPTTWSTLINDVKNGLYSPSIPMFQIDGKKVNVEFIISDNYTKDPKDIRFKSTYTPRSKGAIQ